MLKGSNYLPTVKMTNSILIIVQSTTATMKTVLIGPTIIGPKDGEGQSDR